MVCLCRASHAARLQAANLLRALRQNKEAAGLGLLEGVKGERAATDIEASGSHSRPSAPHLPSRRLLHARHALCCIPLVLAACRGVFPLRLAIWIGRRWSMRRLDDPVILGPPPAVRASPRQMSKRQVAARPSVQVEAKKERLLSKRVQSLSRFLLEALNKECVAGAWWGRGAAGGRWQAHPVARPPARRQPASFSQLPRVRGEAGCAVPQSVHERHAGLPAPPPIPVWLRRL